MKVLSLLISVAALVATLFFLVTDFPDIGTVDGILYLLMLIILLLICITGIVINKPVGSRIHYRFRVHHYRQ